jgi:hypothetical protein
MPSPAPRRALIGAALILAVAAPLLTPSPAEARWARHGWGWRPAPVYVAPPRNYYVPVPYYPVRLRSPVWVPPHVDRYGNWVPGYRR